MLDVGIGAAFVAGMLSFLSPCVLPIVPPYLCYLAGIGFERFQDDQVEAGITRRLLKTAVFFVLGFTTVFVALGATASLIGQALARHFDLLAIVAGILIMAMGLHFLGVLKVGLLQRDARLDAMTKPAGIIGAYVMGLAFAFGWTPCVGPLLAAILFVAGAEETATKGAGLLLVYSLGIGLPFLIAAGFAVPFLKWAKRFRRHLPRVEQAMGGLLVLTGLLFMTGQMSTIAYWLLETFPVFTQLG